MKEIKKQLYRIVKNHKFLCEPSEMCASCEDGVEDLVSFFSAQRKSDIEELEKEISFIETQKFLDKRCEVADFIKVSDISSIIKRVMDK